MLIHLHNLYFYEKNQNFSIFANIKECALYSLKSPISPNVYTRHSERPYSWAVRLCVYTGVWRYLTRTRGRQPTFRLIKHCKIFLSAVRGKIVKIRHYEKDFYLSCLRCNAQRKCVFADCSIRG